MSDVPIGDGGQGRLVTYRVDELRPHPGYLRHHITVPSSRLSPLSVPGAFLPREPLQITPRGTILDGYARWEAARRLALPTIDCLEYELSEEEALLWLIQKHQRSDGLNAFCRILLALELEPWFKARARGNQQLGGLKKGSSNLAEADRLDVRSEVAAAADVSTGNVGKVKQLASAAHPDLLEALRAGEVSIHKASVWLRKPDKQLDALGVHRNRRGITTAVNSLLRAHQGHGRGEQLDASHIVEALGRFSSEQSDIILVAEVKVPGIVLLVSTALRQTLTSQGALNI
jgi:ParB-like chromosome segregation protein Spo0J